VIIIEFGSGRLAWRLEGLIIKVSNLVDEKNLPIDSKVTGVVLPETKKNYVSYSSLNQKEYVYKFIISRTYTHARARAHSNKRASKFKYAHEIYKIRSIYQSIVNFME